MPIIGVMMLKIGYFAEPSAPGAKPAVLWVASGDFATYSGVIGAARQTAQDLEAHSFSIDWPSGASDLYFRDGEGWRLK
jgi:hypothetical protein